MTSATLLELADRVATLSGPCRETDALIVIALDLWPEWCAKGGKLWIDLEANPSDPPIRYAFNGRRSKGNPPIGHYKPFTASLDAAMTLVPENLDIEMSRDAVKPAGKLWCVYLSAGDPVQTKFIPILTRGDTAPLALTAASLLARAASESSHG
jgi:hypothetical protein